jgi:heat shock protein HslJ
VGGTSVGDFARDCRIRLAEQRTQELREQMPVPPAGHPEAQAAPGVAAAVVGAWHLERMEVDGEAAELAPQPRVSLRIAQDGRVTGMASVNRYFGGAVFEAGGRVSWTGTMASTQMAGPEPLMAQEQRYLAALARTSRWQAEGNGLVLSSEDGAVKLSFLR